MKIKYCPECKTEIKKVDFNPITQNDIYYCGKCKNRFIINSEFEEYEE